MMREEMGEERKKEHLMITSLVAPQIHDPQTFYSSQVT